MGSVMCPSVDHAENAGECLPSNLQQFKPQILPIIALNSVIFFALTHFQYFLLYKYSVTSCSL